MFRRLKRPVTHAAALWILVGIAAGMMFAVLAYTVMLANIRSGGPLVFPPKTKPMAEQQPSIFGKVLEVKGDALRVESKQPFDTVIVEEGTSLTSVGGAAMTLADIRLGATVTATGKDLGGGTLLATAVVVLENPENDMPPVPAATTLLQAPADWTDWWKELPAFIGWGDGSSEAVVAVRGYAPLLPAVSVELYGKNGRIAERLELDVPGYGRMKPANPFLTPEEAEAELRERGIVAGNGRSIAYEDEGAVFQSASGEGIVIQPPSLQHGIGLMLLTPEGRVEAVPVSAISFAKEFPDARITPEFRVSPDGRWLLAVLTAPHAEFGPLRSVHLIDLKKLGL